MSNNFCISPCKKIYAFFSVMGHARPETGEDKMRGLKK